MVDTEKYAKLPHDKWYSDYDWAEAFGCAEYMGGQTIDPTQIAEVELWHVELGGYGPEHNAAGVFRMEDDTYAVYTGWCDTSGWGCQGGARFTLHPDYEDAIIMGLGDEERNWFGIANPE